MYVCVYMLCKCVYVCVCVYMLCKCVYVCVCVCVCVCVYMDVGMCEYVASVLVSTHVH